MRFIDEAVISLKAGKGGHGCVSFRREKFIPRGGPNGGDGGDGGSVILRASSRMLSLYDFRLRRHYEAENGQPGMGSQMHGRGGQDLYLDLPVGTLVFAITPEGGERLLTDLSVPEEEVVVAQGGQGGKGQSGQGGARARSGQGEADADDQPADSHTHVQPGRARDLSGGAVTLLRQPNKATDRAAGQACRRGRVAP